MFFLALMNRSSLLFILTNFVRVLTVIAIIMAFSGEILIMVRNFNNFSHPSLSSAQNKSDSIFISTPSSSSSNSSSRLLLHRRQTPPPAAVPPPPAPAAPVANNGVDGDGDNSPTDTFSSTVVNPSPVAAPAVAAPPAPAPPAADPAVPAPAPAESSASPAPPPAPPAQAPPAPDAADADTSDSSSQAPPPPPVATSSSSPEASGIPAPKAAAVDNSDDSSSGKNGADNNKDGGNGEKDTDKEKDSVKTFENTCGYVPGTDVPDSAGSIFFRTFTSLQTLILLLLLLFSELPPALPILFKPLTSLYLRTFPLLSSQSSSISSLSGTLVFPGFMQISIASGILSRTLNGQTFAEVASWFLFIMGGINFIFLGLLPLLTRTDIRERRAIFEHLTGGGKKGLLGRAASAASSKFYASSNAPDSHSQFSEKYGPDPYSTTGTTTLPPPVIQAEPQKQGILGRARGKMASWVDEKRPPVINIGRPQAQGGDQGPPNYVPRGGEGGVV